MESETQNIHKKPISLDFEEKKEVLIDFVTRDSKAEVIASKYNVNRVSLYQWKKKLSGTQQ